MKIIFWNTKQNKDHQPVVELIDKTATDLLLLAECSEESLTELAKLYEEVIVPASRREVKCFKINREVSCQCVREVVGTGLSLFDLEFRSLKLTLGALHLQSKFYADPHRQHNIAMDCNTGVNEYENEIGNTDTVLIGDFNMNPFDPGMVVVGGFNSVCSRNIAEKIERTVCGGKCRYFYNPSWKSYSGIGNEIYGSYYYHACSGGHDFHWNNFDQVLLRPSVLNKYDYNFNILHDLRF